MLPGSNPRLETEQVEWGHEHILPSRGLLLIHLPSKEESLWDWLTKLYPTLYRLLLGPLVCA